jgi:hypothetical protein
MYLEMRYKMSYNILLNRIEELRNAALVQDIMLPVNIPGMKACYDRIAAVDFTTALTLLTVGFKIGAGEMLVETFTAPAAGVVVATSTRIFVNSNYSPFIRVTGGVLGDRIAMYVFGYISNLEQG